MLWEARIILFRKCKEHKFLVSRKRGRKGQGRPLSNTSSSLRLWLMVSPKDPAFCGIRFPQKLSFLLGAGAGLLLSVLALCPRSSHSCDMPCCLLAGWQPRWFLLCGGILSYYDSPEDAWKGCKGSIQMAVCEIQGETVRHLQSLCSFLPSRKQTQNWPLGISPRQKDS